MITLNFLENGMGSTRDVSEEGETLQKITEGDNDLFRCSHLQICSALLQASVASCMTA